LIGLQGRRNKVGASSLAPVAHKRYTIGKR